MVGNVYQTNPAAEGPECAWRFPSALKLGRTFSSELYPAPALSTC